MPHRPSPLAHPPTHPPPGRSYTAELGGLLPHTRQLGRGIAHRVFHHCGAALLRLDMEALGAGADGCCAQPGSEEAAKLAYYILSAAVGEVQQDRGRLFEVRPDALPARPPVPAPRPAAQRC